jgi:hypothetical protein
MGASRLLLGGCRGTRYPRLQRLSTTDRGVLEGFGFYNVLWPRYYPPLARPFALALFWPGSAESLALWRATFAAYTLGERPWSTQQHSAQMRTEAATRIVRGIPQREYLEDLEDLERAGIATTNSVA